MTADFVELAGESTAHLRRVVDMAVSEVRQAGASGTAVGAEAVGTVLRRMARKARMTRRQLAIDAEEFGQEWSEQLLDRRPVPPDVQLPYVESVAEAATAALDLVGAVRALQQIIVDRGGPDEDSPELEQAEGVYRLVLSQATEATDGLRRPWQPKDQARFIDTMRADRPKKFYSADEARNYFRPKQG